MTPDQKKCINDIEAEIAFLGSILNGNSIGMNHVAAMQDSITKLKRTLP